jgi:hypothetical protein
VLAEVTKMRTSLTRKVGGSKTLDGTQNMEKSDFRTSEFGRPNHMNAFRLQVNLLEITGRLYGKMVFQSMLDFLLQNGVKKQL